MEQALRQAQKMEAVGRLTGGIAHDFNNLLTAILGNVDLALRRSDEKDERLRRSLNSARQASERAAALVQRLLAFSRQHPLEEKSVNLNKLVQGMSELLRRTIGETIAVETDLASGLWDTAIDPNQLENAILNLAVNARDAMPKGGRLMIDTDNVWLDDDFVAEHGEDLSPGPYIMLAVTDTGTGMSKETARPRFRTILHDQADRGRDRARAEHGVWLRQAIRRAYRTAERGRQRHVDPALFRAAHGRQYARDPGVRGCPPANRSTPASPKPSCSSRTTRR